MTTKKGFKNYQIDKLIGGLNTTSFPSELADGEASELTNFHFIGNELVTATGLSYTGISSGMNSIYGITKLGEDLYSVSNGNVNKNGNLLYGANTRTITIANIPANSYFGFTIDGITKTFKTSSISNLTSQISSWLGGGFTVTNVGTVITIVKASGGAFTLSAADSIKYLEITNWTTHSKIDVTIDGNTYTYTGNIFGSISQIYTDIQTNIGATDYFSEQVGDKLLIAKKDGFVSVSKNEYNRWTYSVGFRYADTPISGQYHTSTTFGIDGANYNFTVGDGLNTRIISNGRPFNGDLIIKYFEGKLSEVNTGFGFGSSFAPGYIGGTKLVIHKACKLTVVQTFQTDSVRLKNNTGTTLATATVSGGLATFNYDITPGTYRLEATSNDSYPLQYGTSIKSNELFTAFGDGSVDGNNIYFISSISVEGQILNTSNYNYTFRYLKSSGGFDTVWTSGNRTSYFGQNHTLNINKSDYSIMTFVQTSTGDGGMSPSLYTVYSENDNKSLLNTTSYTTPTLTITNLGLGLFDNCYYMMQVNKLGMLLIDYNLSAGNVVFISDDDGVGHTINIDELGGNPVYGIIHQGKIILGGKGGRIKYSKTWTNTHPHYIYDFSGYDAGTQLVGNNEAVTGFITGQNGLYLFKNNEIWRSSSFNDIGGTTPTFNYNFDKVANNGIIHQRCVTQANQDVIYYDHLTRAIRRLGYEQNSLDIKDRKISDKIDQILLSIPNDTENTSYSEMIHITYKAPLVKLYFADESATNITGTFEKVIKKPNRCIIYDVEKNAFSEENINMYEGGMPLLSCEGGYVVYNNAIYQYNFNTDITTGSVYKSGQISLGKDVGQKRIGMFELVGEIRGTKTVEIKLYRDDSEEVILIGDETTPTKRIVSGDGIFRIRVDLYEVGVTFLKWEVVVTSGTGSVKLSDINFSFKRDEGFSNYF